MQEIVTTTATVLPAKKYFFGFQLLKPGFHSQIRIKSSKNCFGGVFSKFVFPHIIIANREVIEVQNKSFGKYYCQNLRKGTVSQNMYGVKISNLT